MVFPILVLETELLLSYTSQHMPNKRPV